MPVPGDRIKFRVWYAQHRRRVRRIAVLTGAGISAESGIPTFRGRESLWRGMDPTELFTPFALSQNPLMVWEMYDELRGRIAAAEPNPGHIALKRLERAREVVIATQNIDGLHQRAGSNHVLELHGSLWRLRCDVCGYAEENPIVPLTPLPPACPGCAGILRPDIVLYTEPLPVDVLEDARLAAEECDLMLVIGTSGVVYPAAALPAIARAHGALVIEVNPEPTALTDTADYIIRAPSAKALPWLVGEL
ncbi:MAG: SIR2 family NAD-dependent protein deacylase [Armatimonadota bacterium]